MRTQKEANRRIVTVTVETERVLLVRRTDTASESRCEQCGARVTIRTMNAPEAPTSRSEFVEPRISTPHHPVGSS